MGDKSPGPKQDKKKGKSLKEKRSEKNARKAERSSRNKLV